MRTAVRTSIVTAALAGALLAPAAVGAAGAFAAPAAAHGVTSVYGTVSDDDRYAGEPVYLGEGLVAVLRNGAEGPEAWIRFVGSQWKPGDVYMVHVLTVLDRTHPSDTANGLLLSLTGADTSAPVLTVTKDAVTASYPLPKAGTAKAPEAPKATESPVEPAPEAPKKAPKTPKTPAATVKDRYDGEVVLVGKGRIAVLRNDSEGPEVWIRAVAENWKPADGRAGRVLATLNPSSPHAVLDGTEYRLARTDNGRYGLTVHVQGEGASDFYLLPEAKTSDKTVAKTTAVVKPAADVKPQTVAQTVVVPQGAVAAGAEIAAEDTDNSTTLAAGGGLIAILAALGAARTARSRADRKRA
ncbi:hypothetical protein HYE82_14105 [Streptomyces sp. BR123]|uniref:hypothetical protein n=1 Tax=Streptomyces sp. BR123 TaxID=2749828 RepID=UPI0015C4BB33|nr:hypothetical protein [Streptomyces sp. BR123]NXY95502.1 hypothetical protein [Streptomyces sp. BR123]